MFCPLDCWDVCGIKIKNSKFIADEFSRFLCYKLNHYFDFKREIKAKLNSKEIPLNSALEYLFFILKTTTPNKVLFIKGSGNMGIMQNVTKLFFNKYKAYFAIGSTCDGIGEKGIKKTRKKSLVLPTYVLRNAKRFLIWGRNPYITNTHLIPFLKNKEVFTIDVIKTKTAKNSNRFFQVKVNSDYFLAILLSQLVIENNKIKTGKNFEKFKEIVFSYSKKELLEKIGLTFEEVKELYEFIKKGCVVLLGLGVAKCKECYKTTAAIDSLFFMLDFFGKKDKGVAFLGSSNFGINNPFDIEIENKIPLFDINLDEFDVVFIQGANPLFSFVNQKEWKKLKDKKTIVFGKYWDETAKISTLFIPTKDFFEKKDVRGSYFDEYVRVTTDIKKTNIGISEYELTKFLFEKFNFKGLKEEDEYIKEILSSELLKINDNLYKKLVFEKPIEIEEFSFLDEKFNYKNKEFNIVTAKYEKSLNSQFKRDTNIYINPNSKKRFIEFMKSHFNITFDEDIPVNIAYSKGGIINKILQAKGENAYYELDFML